MKKIKWFNLLKLVIGVMCISLILHDAYLIVFKWGMFSWYGLATHILAWFILDEINEDFKEQLEVI